MGNAAANINDGQSYLPFDAMYQNVQQMMDKHWAENPDLYKAVRREKALEAAKAAVLETQKHGDFHGSAHGSNRKFPWALVTHDINSNFTQQGF